MSTSFALCGVSFIVILIGLEMSSSESDAWAASAKWSAFVGKTLTAAMYVCQYVWMPELLSTDIRSIGFGFGSMVARVCGFLVPMVLTLDRLPQNLVFIVMSFASAISVLFLPETNGKPMTQTIDEAKRFYKSK